jgi:urease accessory protein
MTDWLLLQLADSAFPAGGFAHSNGLEAAVQAAEVSRESVRRFIEDALWQAGQGALPLTSAAHREPARLGELDALADAFLVNHVANRASRTQGRAFVETCARVFPEARALREEALRAPLRQHFAPLFGAALRALGVALDDAQRLSIFGVLRGLVSAAVRLGLVGTHEGQQLERALFPTCDKVLQACAGLDAEELAQTNPIADLLSATHDRLYSRLFIS